MHSNGLVWVEHDSDYTAHGLWWQVLSEAASDGTSITVWAHHFAPLYSESSVIDGGLNFLNVTNFLSCIKLGTGSILTVLHVNQSLVQVLSNSVSSESSEDALLIQSHWLGLVILLSLCFINCCGCGFWHCLSRDYL